MELGTFGLLERNRTGGMPFITNSLLTEPYKFVLGHLQPGILCRIKRKRNQ